MPAILPLPFEIAPPFSQTRVHTRWYKACVIRNKKAHCTLVNFCSFARTKGHGTRYRPRSFPQYSIA